MKKVFKGTRKEVAEKIKDFLENEIGGFSGQDCEFVDVIIEVIEE